MNETISTVIPTINRPDGLVEAVNSVLKQTRLPDELVIIDQSQDERSVAEVQKLFSAAKNNNPKLIYVHDTSVKGLVGAKKRGVQESSGDIVSFIEDDVVLEPNYFEMMEKGFIQRPKMQGCSGVMIYAPSYTKIYKLIFHIFHRGIFYDARINAHGPRADKGLNGKEIIMIQSQYLSGGISAYRREIFSHIVFDTVNNLFMFEDIEFSMRAVRHYGKEHYYINYAMRLDHRMSPINRIRIEYRWKRKLCELICFYKKNKNETYALPSLMWLLAGLGFEALYTSVKMQHFGPIKGTLLGMFEGINTRIKSLEV